MNRNLDDATDEVLMKLYQEGEMMAFEVLYTKHSSKVYSYLNKRLNDREQAGEILQEVFFKLHNSKNTYNTQFPFLPWLFTMTRNLMLDYIRKTKKSIQTLPINEEILSEQATDVDGGHDELLEALLKNLSTSQQEAIKLRYLESWSFEDIAKSLQTSPANSRKLVSRGLNSIKEIFSFKKEEGNE